MQEGQASQTAIGSAMNRAVHFALDGEPKILNDDLALDLAGLSDNDPRNLNSARHQRHESRQLRAHMVLRNRYAEDEVASHLASSEGQYVILGAGLDSFAYRRPASLQHIRVFEVDHPATQQWKQARLDDLDTPIPPTVSFVPVNFEVECFSEKLAAYSFDPHRPTVFSWLGVSQYLTREALESTLHEVVGCVKAFRQLIMDFILPEAVLGPADRHQLVTIRTRAERHGEPWLSYYTPQELRTIMENVGFERVIHLGTEEASSRYFAGRADGLTLPGSYNLMNASCPENTP
jgi:methyltransferase (TIGR00027 family)